MTTDFFLKYNLAVNRKPQRGVAHFASLWQMAAVIACVILMGVCHSAIAQNSPAKPKDYVMAIVGSLPITYSDYLRAAAQMGVGLSGEAIDKNVLEALINDKVVLLAARSSGIVISENELGIAIQNYLEQQKTSQAALQQDLAKQNKTWEAFRASMRENLLVQRYRASQMASLLPQGRADSDSLPILEDPYLARPINEKMVEVARKINLGHILVLVPQGASTAQERQLQARAQAAYARLKRREAFAKVAASVSQAPEGKSNRGELGLLPVNNYPEIFVAAVQGYKKGQFTQPLRSPVGFHILKLIESESKMAPISNGKTYVESLVRHILIPAKTEQEIAAARETISALAVQIKHRGAEFAQLAKSHSKDASAANGGVIGWVESGQLVPEFEQVMHTLPLRTLSPPVVTRFGVHLFEVIERRVLAQDTSKETAVSGSDTAQARRTQQQEAVKKWLEDLRSNTYIEYREPPL